MIKSQFRALKRVGLAMWIVYGVSMLLLVILNAIYFIKTKKRESCICLTCDEKNPIIHHDIESITYITVPRPITKKKNMVRMKLAISSWLASSPKSNVILFIDREEFDKTGELPNELDQLFGEGRVQYLGSIRTDHDNVPYINDWFLQGILRSQSKYVCFINSDILLSEKWLKRVSQVYDNMEEENLFLIGQRIDFDLKDKYFKELRFDQLHLLADIDKMVRKSNHLDHSPYGIDTFTFRADKPPLDPYLIPPFIMGRYNWDNWIIGYLNKICQTITFNLNPPIYHINHNRHAFNPNNSKVAINHNLKKVNKDYFGSNYDTKWEIIGDTLKRRHRNKAVQLDPL